MLVSSAPHHMQLNADVSGSAFLQLGLSRHVACDVSCSAAAASCCSSPPCSACLRTSCHMCKALLECPACQFTFSTVILKVISSNYGSLSSISRASFSTERLTDLLGINSLGRLSHPVRFVTGLRGDPAHPVLRPQCSSMVQVGTSVSVVQPDTNGCHHLLRFTSEFAFTVSEQISATQPKTSFTANNLQNFRNPNFDSVIL